MNLRLTFISCSVFTLSLSVASCVFAANESVVNGASTIEQRAIETLETYVTNNIHHDSSSPLGKKKHTLTNVKSVKEIVWSDASLGCPKPGLHYPQVTTTGYLVKLEKGGEIYDVHMSSKRSLICLPRQSKLLSGQAIRKSVKAKQPQKLSTLQLKEILKNSRQDLASKIHLDEKEISVVSVNPVTWPDNALGCAPQGVQTRSKKIEGYRLVLMARGLKYVYHTDKEQRVQACPAIESQ